MTQARRSTPDRSALLGRRFAPALLGLAVLLVAAAPGHPAVTFSTIVSGLSAPTAFVDPPDKLAHRFIAQQRGDILVWDGALLLATPLLDLRTAGKVLGPASSGERGLLAMTVHPNYLANGFAYLYYTSTDWDGGGAMEAGDVVIERYTRSAGNANVLDPASAQVVLVIGHNAAGNHNGGDLKFGPDGYLYVTVGDGGGGCDSAYGSGQDTNQLLGKMLRLDVDGADAYPGDPLRNYAIPADNPLVGFAGEDEIWALGLRNPFRFAFDRLTGDAYIGDVGQDDWEEINRLPAGAVTAGNPLNFGWPCREGLDEAGCGATPASCVGPFVDPVRQEPNAGMSGSWRAVMGGFLYRGAEVTADLGGRYLYGDAGNGQLWLATPLTGAPASGQWSATQVGTGQGPYGFSEDQHGELFVLSSWGGAIRCVHGGAGCPWQIDESRVFTDGFETGGTVPWAVP